MTENKPTQSIAFSVSQELLPPSTFTENKIAESIAAAVSQELLPPSTMTENKKLDATAQAISQELSPLTKKMQIESMEPEIPSKCKEIAPNSASMGNEPDLTTDKNAVGAEIQTPVVLEAIGDAIKLESSAENQSSEQMPSQQISDGKACDEPLQNKLDQGSAKESLINLA